MLKSILWPLKDDAEWSNWYQPSGLCICNPTLGWPYFLFLLFIFKIVKIIYLQQDQEDPAIHCVPSSQADLWAPYHQVHLSHHVDLVVPRKWYRCQRNKIEGFKYILLSNQELSMSTLHYAIGCPWYIYMYILLHPGRVSVPKASGLVP